MPYNWNDSSEKAMLIYAIAHADLKPTPQTWAAVAEKLGGGLNANAVSQKFYKLKREADNHVNGEGAVAPSPAAKKTTKTSAAKSTKTTTAKRKIDDVDKESTRKKTKVDRDDDADAKEPVKDESGAETDADAED